MLIKGNCRDWSDFPEKGNSVGDAYLLNGCDLYCWDGSAWLQIGKTRGETGACGMPGNYVKRLKEVDLTYKGVQVTISSYDDIGALFLDPDNLGADDLAIFDTTFPA